MDIDINPAHIIPTVGAMQASYTAFMALTECKSGKDTVLFIDPGFPVQKPNWTLSANLILHSTFTNTEGKNYVLSWKNI